MGLSEALSDDGSVTGRGGPLRRGTITGVATGLGGMLHTFPFLIPNLGIALKLAYAVVVCELIAIAFIRYRFMGGKLANTIVRPSRAHTEEKVSMNIGIAALAASGVFLGRNVGGSFRHV
jgi:VIT1/CCC1 family predicted Fe2+/Mn2+ transporter